MYIVYRADNLIHNSHIHSWNYKFIFYYSQFFKRYTWVGRSICLSVWPTKILKIFKWLKYKWIKLGQIVAVCHSC